MKPEPTATEAAAYVGMKIAEWGCYAVILIAIAVAWTVTP
jgi:chromate transport protein ChrA